jgi:Ca2+-binding EF-hand superfamily protein
VLTSLGEKLSEDEVDDLLKGVNVTREGNINYRGMNYISHDKKNPLM